MKSSSFIPYKTRRHVLSATQRDELPVILVGEPGSGKSSLAKSIHENGPRSGRPFVKIHRKAMWEEQILSANGGSILFPEWETCDYPERETIRRLVRTRTLQASGTEEGAPLVHMLNARVFLPALHIDGDLLELLELSNLRCVQITIPRLQDRKNEILDIASAILREVAHEQRKDHVVGFDRETSAAIYAYDWPGNIRELRNVLSFALLRADGSQLTMKDLPALGDESVDFFASREEFERATLIEAIRKTRGNLQESARSLRISEEFLADKLREYRLAPNEVDSGA